MGSDMYHYSREVAINSHGGLLTALKKAREIVAKQPRKNKELLAEIDRAINNATIK